MSDEDNQELDNPVYLEEENEASLKEKVANQSAKGGEVAQEDTSRSALHYGEEQEAEPERQIIDGAGSDEPSGVFTGDSMSENGQREPRASDEGSPDDSGAAPSFDARAQTQTPNGATGDPASRLRTSRVSDDEGNEPLGSSDNPQTITATTNDSAEARDQNAPLSAPQSDNDTTPQQEPTVAPNEAPTEIQLDQTSLDENEGGAVVGKLSVVDPNASDNHEITLSDERFEVVDGEVRLKPGIALDHEAEGSISLEITAIDSDGASFTQSFDITVNDLNEVPTELSLEGGLVASNQAGAIVGQVTVTDPDQGEVHQFAVSDERFEVADGFLKLRDDVTLSDAELGAIDVQVTAVDSGGAEITESFAFQAVDAADVSVSSGFRASYFDVNHSLRQLDEIDWSSTPTHEDVVSEINYQNGRSSFWEGGSKDTFGARITGNIDVEEGGSFEFFLGGDDGAVLYIDGVEVIENDGLHSYHTRTADIELEPGTHTIEVRYFENYGHAGLKLEWDGPGTDGRELVVAPDVDDLQTVNGVPLTIELDVSAPETEALQSVTQAIEGLPEGTVVSAGTFTAEVGESGVVDISNWDTSLLSIQTPIDFIGDVSAQITTTTSFETGGDVTTTSDLDFSVSQAELPPISSQIQTGFHASYFDVDHSLRRLDQIDWTDEPTHEEIVGEINYKNGRDSFWEGGSTDTFGAKITGEINVEEGGSFDFYLGGDDGAILFVNGVEVIENDGLHGFRTRSGEIELEPGTHSIEVRYFENYGHAGLKLEWDGPGTDGRELVVADDDLSVAENGVIPVNIGGGDLSDQASVQISGLPADTILMSDDNVLVSDGGEVDLTGWDMSLLEIAPPPGFEGTISGEVTTTDRAFNGQEVTGSDSFSIKVGDAPTADAQQENDAEAEFLSSEEDNSNSENWVAASDNDASSDDGNDEVLNEDVEQQGADEQGYDTTETYERQDW
ncbi:PA14 domain-containing protein [uncultured Roseobacter sp.]|uniref:PA14 domain-containing protein n=1 Tax=uncultured Roseobacter sp. TaxID=114847 RepID=UPI002620D615|nr:PA14 domain-containing protein [uncultured Roseobacter sp.]